MSECEHDVGSRAAPPGAGRAHFPRDGRTSGRAGGGRRAGRGTSGGRIRLAGVLAVPRGRRQRSSVSPRMVLTEFAKSTFGTADKPVLLTGMAVVIVAVAAVAGIAVPAQRPPGRGGRRGARAGRAVAAVILAPAFAPLDLLAPARGAAAGVGVLRTLHRRRGGGLPGPAPPRPDGGRAVPVPGPSRRGCWPLVGRGRLLVAGRRGGRLVARGRARRRRTPAGS